MKALVYKNQVVDLKEEEHEVHPDNTWMDAPEGCETGWILEDGSLVAPPPAPSLSYDAARMQEYPAIGEQLDMLYHAIDGDEGLKTQFNDFYTAIKAVKDANPKPAE